MIRANTSQAKSKICDRKMPCKRNRFLVFVKPEQLTKLFIVNL